METNKNDLIKYRLENAKEKLHSAIVLRDNGLYKDSISRSYYAIFSALKAIIAQDGVDFSKHTGCIGYFQQNYVKTGIIEKEYSKIVTSAFQIRNQSDYEDMFIASKNDADIQIEAAKKFIGKTEEILKIEGIL